MYYPPLYALAFFDSYRGYKSWDRQTIGWFYLQEEGSSSIFEPMKYLLILSTLLFVPLAHAEDYKPEGTRVSLSAKAYEDVVNDEVVVSYRIEAKGNNADQLRKKVDEVAAKVTARLKREKVKHATTNRSLSPSRDSGFFSTKNWELVQTGRVTTQDIDAVPGWLADIEAAGVKLSGLQFQVSDKLRHKVEEQLRIQAIQDFRAKAANIAGGLAAKSFRIIDMRTHANDESRPQLQDNYRLEKSKYSEPALSGGESRISVMVSGAIETPFKDFPVK